MESQSDRKTMILDHRRTIHKFDPKVAHTVAFLRVNRKLGFGKPIQPKSIRSLSPILLKEMTLFDKVYEGRVLNFARNADIVEKDAAHGCSKCHKTRYCSRECQTEDWFSLKHAYVCLEKPDKPITEEDRPSWSVYDLEKICNADFCPGLHQRALRVDYGFVNCSDIKEEANLLGVYQGLIKIMRVDMVDLHKACVSGALEKFIVDMFENYPAKSRGAYYPWFLERPHIAKNPYPLPM